MIERFNILIFYQPGSVYFNSNLTKNTLSKILFQCRIIKVKCLFPRLDLYGCILCTEWFVFGEILSTLIRSEASHLELGTIIPYVGKCSKMRHYEGSL